MTRADIATRFQPGNNAGKGRPMASRQRIGEALIPMFGELLEEDQARVALRTMRDNEPGKFFQIAASLLPKQLEALIQAQTSSGGFTPGERRAIRGVLDAIEAAGARGIEPVQCFDLISHALRAELAKPLQIEALPPVPSLAD